MPDPSDEDLPGVDEVGRGANLARVRLGDRPRLRDGSSESEEVIFAATEELLGEAGFAGLGVSEICRRAGVARGTFYFYFSSKYAVVASLLARVMDEIFESMSSFASGGAGRSPAESLEAGLRGGWQVWTTHRLLLRFVSEHWAQVPELRELWLQIMGRFTGAIAGEIDRERAAGLAPPGIESRRLATLLLWSAERHAYVAGLGLDPELPGEEAIFQSVLAFWLRAIYGETPAGTSAG
jgi:TetR/AcrR family transcriptional regulator, ethionamide resistance regulator